MVTVIVEDGAPDELVARRGLYHSLFDRQFHQGPRFPWREDSLVTDAIRRLQLNYG